MTLCNPGGVYSISPDYALPHPDYVVTYQSGCWLADKVACCTGGNEGGVRSKRDSNS